MIEQFVKNAHYNVYKDNFCANFYHLHRNLINANEFADVTKGTERLNAIPSFKCICKSSLITSLR